MGRSSIGYQFTRAAVIARDQHSDVLEAGQNGAFSVAAVLGALAFAGHALENSFDSPSMLAPMERSDESGAETPPTSFLLTRNPLPTADAKPTPIAFRNALAYPSAGLERATPLTAIAISAAMADQGMAPPPTSLATPVPLTALPLELNLALKDVEQSQSQRPIDFVSASPVPPRRTSALESTAENLVGDWAPPRIRDLSLFVAADDEALSWSFSQASPNYNRLVYRENRVEMGEIAAGVSLGLGDSDLALAVVEKEQSSNLGYSVDARYVGLIWTYRR